MTEITNTKPILYIGESWGVRASLRNRLARHFSVPASRIVFEQCAESDVDTEITRRNLSHHYTVVTPLDLREIGF